MDFRRTEVQFREKVFGADRRGLLEIRPFADGCGVSPENTATEKAIKALIHSARANFHKKSTLSYFNSGSSKRYSKPESRNIK
jgi:hypothetical protein